MVLTGCGIISVFECIPKMNLGKELTSLSLLCLKSRTFSSFRLASVHGRLVKAFSLNARVCKLIRHPTSGGRVVNLFPYRYNSDRCVKSFTDGGSRVIYKNIINI